MSPNQIAALSALLSGGSRQEAAEAAGVNRTTLYRWFREDTDFVAEYNAGRRALLEGAEARAMNVAQKALDAIMAELEEGNGKLGLDFLKALGVLSGERPLTGSDDPDELAAKARFNAEMKELLRPGAAL